MKAHEQEAISQMLSGPNGNGPHPVVKLAIKYWWMSIPIGLAMYGRYRGHKEREGDYKLWQAFSDFGTVMGPVMTFVGLTELASRLERKGKLELGNGRKIKDAQFTVQPTDHQDPQQVQSPTYQPEET